MNRVTLASALTLLVACAGEDVPVDDAESTAAVPTAADVFIDAPPDNALLLFVGADSATRTAGEDGAAFVPLSTFSVERDGIPNELPPADSMATMLGRAGVTGVRTVIVGEPIPAGRAFAALDYLGLADRTALLDGGRSGLTAPGDSAASPDDGAAAAPASRSGALRVSPRDDMIVDAEWVHARLDDPDVVILDARPPAEYSGETPGTGIDRPGHIPGARNVFWQTLVRSPEDSRLRDEAELRRIFEAAGARPGSTIVSYCRTGGQASFLYAVARHLGYDVKLYDGSFIDWSRTDFPVER